MLVPKIFITMFGDKTLEYFENNNLNIKARNGLV